MSNLGVLKTDKYKPSILAYSSVDYTCPINKVNKIGKLDEKWVCAVVRYRSESGLVVRGSKKAGAKKILGEKISGKSLIEWEYLICRNCFGI